MKVFWMVVAAAILMVGSTCAKAEKPSQAPAAMTEQEIKDYIDAQVDAAVHKAMNRTAAASSTVQIGGETPWGPTVRTAQACPAGASCPAGCTDNGDGTCSCPAGTSCGMSQYGASACGAGGCGASADDGGGSCASGSCGKGGSRRHLLGRFFGRRRGK